MSDWKAVRYGDVMTNVRTRARGDADDEQLLSVTAANGVIGQMHSGRRDISAADKSKYLVVEPGDVVYNTMRMWQGVSGFSDMRGIVSPAYTILRSSEQALDGRFLAHLMKLPCNIRTYRAYSQGLVSDTWNLKFRALASLELEIPPLEEQRRIVEVLDTIDETIRGTESTIAKLRQQEQGLEVRLLRESQDAQELPLMGVATVDRGKFTARPRNDPAFYGGKYPFIQTGDVARAQRATGIEYSQTLNELGLGQKSAGFSTAVQLQSRLQQTSQTQRSLIGLCAFLTAWSGLQSRSPIALGGSRCAFMRRSEC